MPDNSIIISNICIISIIIVCISILTCHTVVLDGNTTVKGTHTQKKWLLKFSRLSEIDIFHGDILHGDSQIESG